MLQRGEARAISSFVRVVVIIEVMRFLKSFQLFDDMVDLFCIILSYFCFDIRSIKQNHGNFFCIIRWQIGSVRFSSLSNID